MCGWNGKIYVKMFAVLDLKQYSKLNKGDNAHYHPLRYICTKSQAKNSPSSSHQQRLKAVWFW